MTFHGVLPKPEVAELMRRADAYVLASRFDNNPVALLEQMLHIPSLSGQEGELARFLVEQMRSLGLHSYVDESGNAVGEAGHCPQPNVI